MFSNAFRIGRDGDCDLIVQHEHVSRHHVEIDFREDCWWVHDLESTNGIYVNDKKVMHAPLLDRDQLVLGKDGPCIHIRYIDEEEMAHMDAPDEYSEGDEVNRKKVLLFVLAALILGAAGFFYGKNEFGNKERFKERAHALFMDVRSKNVQIADVPTEEGLDRLEKAQRIIELQKSRQEDLDDYRGYLIRMGFYGEIEDLTERQIYRAAFLLSEDELMLPASFVAEVARCIQSCWIDQQVGDMETALIRARLSNRGANLVKTLREYGLPQEFFYIPLTISGFESDKDLLSTFEAQGGLWQLSVRTAERYGLQVDEQDGPSILTGTDERYDPAKSTRAAIQLLHEIYRKEALGSGLLTIALYLQYQENESTGKITEQGSLLADVPLDIESRNLWYIMERFPYRISDEVYHTVVHVFSAVVIGQDPQLFGLDFSTPTATNLSSNVYRAFQ